jgi:hypothetical protein
VTYLTCIKHPYVAQQYEVTAASFSEISDKSYWDDLAVDVQSTEAAAKARLDKQTINEVEQLCCYQVLGDKIAKLPTTLRSLRELRSKFGHEIPYKPWVIAWVSLIFVEFLLAGAFGAAEPHSAEQKIYRILLIVVGIAAGISLVMGWITGFRNATQRELRKSYSKQFEDVVAPCMRLAGADPAMGFDNLEYAQEVAEHVGKTYEHLKTRFLTI